MNKGQNIRRYIKEGLSNEAILHRVDTTVNSIRWHRSKMQKPSDPRTSTSVGALTVGAALERFNLSDDVRDCLGKLALDNPTAVFKELASWKFVTNSRVTSRFGQCDYRARTIEIHAKLLNLFDDLRGTFLHECAHALDKIMNGHSSHHGRPWQRIMAVGFGLPTNRCGGHSAEAIEALTTLQKAKCIEVWECDRCGHEFPITRKRKYPATSYRHRKCSGIFKVKT